MPTELDHVMDKLEAVAKGQTRLENKIDRIRYEQINQRGEITSHGHKIEEHHRILLAGAGGQKAVLVQVAEAHARLEGVEEDIRKLHDEDSETDPAELKKEKLSNWGKIIGIIGLVISQVVTWAISLGK